MGMVAAAQSRNSFSLPLPVQVTEAAVGIAVRILLAVLLLQQFQSEFAMLFALLAKRA
jgi:hypothetical protein